MPNHRPDTSQPARQLGPALDASHGLIHVEAVNLDQLLADTSQVSVRRAGGYLLLELIREITQRFKQDMKPISTGASAGLFAVSAGTASLPALRERVRRFLLEHDLYRFATVQVVGTDELPQPLGNFQQQREALLALVRRRQLQHLSLSPQGLFGSNKPNSACAWDQVRPATSTITAAGDEKLAVSTATAARWCRGRELRQCFYKRELGLENSSSMRCEFTDNLEELSSFTPGWSASTRPDPLLDGKIAIFYADGNSFGQVVKNLTTPGQLHEWDTTIRSARHEFLHRLLDRLATMPEALAPAPQSQPDGTPNAQDGAELQRLRLETLLWGGDELLLVVPAWLGWLTAQLFFKHCCISNLQNKDLQKQAMTHSAGLLFAHHNAPLRNLEVLAKALAEQGKKHPELKQQDNIHWMVLESFDHAGGELDDYWRRRHLPWVQWSDLALHPQELRAWMSHAAPLHAQLPRASLYGALERLRQFEHLKSGELRLLQRHYANLGTTLDALQPEHAQHWSSLWESRLKSTWSATAPDNPEQAKQHARFFLLWLELAQYWPKPSAEPDATPHLSTQV